MAFVGESLFYRHSTGLSRLGESIHQKTNILYLPKGTINWEETNSNEDTIKKYDK